MLTYDAPKLGGGPTSTAADFLGIAQRGFANTAEIANTIDARVDAKAAQQKAEARQAEIDARARQEWEQKQAANVYAKNLMDIAKPETISEADAEGINKIADKLSILQAKGGSAKEVKDTQAALQKAADAASEKARYNTTGLKEMMNNLSGDNVDVATALQLKSAVLNPIDATAKEQKVNKSSEVLTQYAKANSKDRSAILKTAADMGLDMGVIQAGTRAIDQNEIDNRFKQAQLGLQAEGIKVQREQINKPTELDKQIAYLVSSGVDPKKAPLIAMGMSTSSKIAAVPKDVEDKINDIALPNLANSARAYAASMAAEGYTPEQISAVFAGGFDKGFMWDSFNPDKADVVKARFGSPTKDKLTKISK